MAAASMTHAAMALMNIVVPLNLGGSIFNFSLPPPPELKDALSPNTVLAQAEMYGYNQLTGPESMVFSPKDYLITGLSNGKLKAISTTNPNANIELSDLCAGRRPAACLSRPLGIRDTTQYSETKTDLQYLLFIDSYSGVYSLEIQGKKGPQRVIDIAKLNSTFLNDLVVTRNKRLIFFTSSSSVHGRSDFMKVLLSGDISGRVYVGVVVPNGIQVKELKGDLHFPNGVALPPDERSVLVAEGGRCRILRIGFSGQVSIFSENLPGFPDNIRSTGRGTYWVGLSSCRSKSRPSVIDKYGPDMRYRIMMAWNENSARGQYVRSQAPSCGIAVELDAKGKIIRSIQDPTGSVFSSVSEIQEHGDYLYIGSYDKPYIGRLAKTMLPPLYQPPPPTTTLPPPPPPSDPYAKILHRVSVSISKLSSDKLKGMVLNLISRLLELWIEVKNAHKRANSIQLQLNAARGIAPSSNGTTPATAVDDATTTATPDTTQNFFAG